MNHDNKRYTFSFFLFIAILQILPTESFAADSWQGRVVNILDGATLDIAKLDGTIERVNLYAIRVLATDTFRGDGARRRTTSWCNQWGNVATVLPMGLGSDGQMVARVIVGQKDLADVLTKACLAAVDVPTCRRRGTMECTSWYAWELQCRDEKKGLWAAKIH